MKNNSLLRAQIDTLMRDKNIDSVTDIVPFGHPLYQKIYRQLFNNKDADITFDVVREILEKFPDVSAEWLTRGEGLQTRAKVVLPPQQRQDIHLAAGARAAISQSGSARIEPDEPIGQQSLMDLLDEKDARIAQLEKDLDTLKDAIRVLSAK